MITIIIFICWSRIYLKYFLGGLLVCKPRPCRTATLKKKIRGSLDFIKPIFEANKLLDITEEPLIVIV